MTTILLLLQWQVFFSPNGGAEAAIVRNIDSARHQILVQAYSFTSDQISSALLRARKRGCNVRIIFDRSQMSARASKLAQLCKQGIDVLIDVKSKIQHSKVILIDSAIVSTGSYNFSDSAEESNAENLLIINEPQLAVLYIRNWQSRAADCFRLIPQ